MPTSAHRARDNRPPRTPPRIIPSSRLQQPPSPTSPSNSHLTDDERLAESFLIVGDEDDLSTIGSSLQESINGDIFSDSSLEETRDPWDGSTDSGSSDHDADPYQHAETATINALDTVDGILLANPDPSLGSSYIDAEATATLSQLESSRSTIHRGLQHGLSDSQVRLIMPDPANSFLTSSDNTTPSASLGNLEQLGGVDGKGLVPEAAFNQKQRAKGVIDKDWLEASSRLWNISPDASSIFGDERIDTKGNMNNNGYTLLASQEELNSAAKQAIGGLQVKEEGEAGTREVKQMPKRARLRTALETANLAGLRGIARSWSSRISVLALASFLSFALYHSYGPSEITSVTNPVTTGTVSHTTVSKTGSIWDHLATPFLPQHAPTQTSDAPTATALVPDLHLIKQALSTLSGRTGKAPRADTAKSDAPVIVIKDEVSNKRKRKSSFSDDPCHAISIPNPHVGLAVHTVPIVRAGGETWSRTLRRKISRDRANISQTIIQTHNTTTNVSCECELSHRFTFDVMRRLTQSLDSVYGYAATAGQTIMAIYAPAIEELRKEFNELIALTRTIAETTSSLTQFIIHRAAKGVGVSRRALDSASKQIRANMPQLPQPHIDAEALTKAREKLDHLAEYVEDQAAQLADYVEEQTLSIHDKSMESLRQAKRGLDKLIIEARRLSRENNPVLIKGPMPKTVRRQKQLVKRPMTERGRRVRKMEERRVAEKRLKAGRGFPKPEERTRAGKIWDMLFHGAHALVV